MDGGTHPSVHTTEGMAKSDGVIETHPQAVRTAWSEDYALRRARDDDHVLEAMVALKKSFSSPSFQA